jgi:PhnB protein
MFAGDCRQAMEFYQSCLGGKLTMQTFGEAPVPSPDDYKQKIMHAMLEHESLTIMASDEQPGNPVIQGTNIHLSIVGTDEAKLKDMFAKMSVGGTVTQPLAQQFWGDTFGMFTDKFGIHWMFNIAAKKS